MVSVWRLGSLSCLVKWVFWFFFRFELKYFDPFLVLDEFSGGLLCFPPFSEWYSVACACFCLFLWLLRVLISWTSAVSAPAGFPDHPHRGLFLALSLSTLSFSWENFTLHNERPKLGWFSFLCFSFVFSFQVLRQLPTCYRYVQLVIPLFIRTYFSATKQNKEKNDNLFIFTCLNEIIPLEMNMTVGCIWFFHATRNFLL